MFTGPFMTLASVIMSISEVFSGQTAPSSYYCPTSYQSQFTSHTSSAQPVKTVA